MSHPLFDDYGGSPIVGQTELVRAVLGSGRDRIWLQENVDRAEEPGRILFGHRGPGSSAFEARSEPCPFVRLHRVSAIKSPWVPTAASRSARLNILYFLDRDWVDGTIERFLGCRNSFGSGLIDVESKAVGRESIEVQHGPSATHSASHTHAGRAAADDHRQYAAVAAGPDRARVSGCCNFWQGGVFQS